MNLYDHLDAGGKAGLLADRVNELQSFIAQGNVRAAMETVSALQWLVPGIATDLVESGVREGMSQAAMARALGVPASTLRGAKREFAR